VISAHAEAAARAWWASKADWLAKASLTRVVWALGDGKGETSRFSTGEGDVSGQGRGDRFNAVGRYFQMAGQVDFAHG
jgi:hypothetical protein